MLYHPFNTKSGLVTPVMMAIERPWRSIAIYVFMASGRSNALRALECSADDRLMKTDSKNNYNSLHELIVQTKR